MRRAARTGLLGVDYDGWCGCACVTRQLPSDPEVLTRGSDANGLGRNPDRVARSVVVCGVVHRHTRTACVHSTHTAGCLQWNLVIRWGSSGHCRGKGMRAPLPTSNRCLEDREPVCGGRRAFRACVSRGSSTREPTLFVLPRVFPGQIHASTWPGHCCRLQDEATGGVGPVRCHIAQHMLTQWFKRTTGCSSGLQGHQA